MKRSLSMPRLLLLAALVLPCTVRAQAAAGAESTASFEGIWLFDAARSDDPAQLLQRDGAPGGRRPGGGPPAGGGMGMGGRGGRGGPGGHGGPPGGAPGEDEALSESTHSRGGGDPRRAFDRIMHPAKKMVVYVERDRFQVEEDEGTPRVYTFADSLLALGVKPLNDEATVRVQGRRLEAKQPLGRRGALLETYELSADGRRLTIRARRVGGPEGAPNPVFTRAYTRYDGE